MSWTFQLQKINHSFERIGQWYKEFMNKTELCFREMHGRVTALEERQPPQPTDEQVERLLRKVLAEKFTTSNPQPIEGTTAVNATSAVASTRRFLAYPNPIPLDPASLVVEPDSVPSKAYVETFKKLEAGLASFPDRASSSSDDDVQEITAVRKSRGPRFAHDI